MSKFTKPKINWTEIEKLVPQEQKQKFMHFKGKSDGYLRRVLSNPPELPKIDWGLYEKSVPVPGLVKQFQQSYEGYKVPYPEDTLSAEVDKQWDSMQQEIQQFIQEQQKDIDLRHAALRVERMEIIKQLKLPLKSRAKKQLDHIAALPPFQAMTMEMFRDMYPDLALDPVNRPTFWPHNEEEQLGYKPPELKSDEKSKVKK